MPSKTFLHQSLDRGVFNIEEIRKSLELEYSVNVVDRSGKPPLLKVLESDECSVDLVELLIDYGADVNYTTKDISSPLITALYLSRGETIIKMLLKKGAKPNSDYFHQRSSLKFALHCNASKDVVKLLLEAGCALNVCNNHGSALHCATQYKGCYSALNEDVLNLLLEAGADVNRVDRRGRSLLCFALQQVYEARDIQLLLRAGTSLSACTLHTSALLCATEFVTKTSLRTDVVQLLLNEGARVDEVDSRGDTPLQRTLKYGQYETGAIRLLLDHSDLCLSSDGDDSHVESLLDLAVQSVDCKPSTVKLLLGRGARVHKTLLHAVVENEHCHPSIIKVFLENGALVNARDIFDATPLMKAVNSGRDLTVLKMLLEAGARLAVSKESVFWSFDLGLDLANYGYEGLECFKLLLKYSYLDNLATDTGKLIQGCRASKAASCFEKKCEHELRKMESKTVRNGLTLREFVSGHSSSRMCDLNQLLLIMADNEFPIYFDVVSARVGKELMETKLHGLLVYTEINCSDSSQRGNRVTLNYDSVCEIARYLSHEDLLRLIMAFCEPKDLPHTGRARQVKRIRDKISSWQLAVLRKHPKLS